MATDIIARGMAANAKKSVTELGDKVESEKWIGTKAEWEAVDKSTIKDGTIVYITDDETVILYDKAEMEKIATQVATDRKAAETAAQTAQAVADSLPDDYTTAVGKIAENTAEIGRVKMSDKELKRRVDALYSIGQGITHKFETDSSSAYAKTIPTGGRMMSVKSIGGKNLVFNQMYKKFDYVSGSTLNCKPIFKSHKYLLRVDYNVSENTRVYLYFRDAHYTGETNRQIVKDVAAGSGKISWITSPLGEHSDGGDFGVFRILTDADGNQKLDTSPFSNHEIFDLTQMFGIGNEPTSVEEFEKIFPADYYPYNAGEIISAGTEEIVEQGKNLWDEVWEEGSINYNAGLDTPNPTAIRSKSYTPIIPNSTYIFAYTGSTKFGNVKVRFYDHSKNYIGGDSKSGDTYPNKLFITPSGAFYIRFTLPSEYGNAYKNDIALIADSSGAYAPFHRNVYQIPEAIKALPGYGWSAGTARNYVDYENKKYVQCVNSVDLGTKNWLMYKDGDYTPFFYLNGISDIRGGTPNFLCSKYQYAKIGVTDNVTGLYVLESTIVRVRDTAYTDAAAFKQAMQGVMLYYELATPIVTDISTLIDDDFLRNLTVEAGGSITFKNSNGDDYRIPVPNEEEYIVKLSEVGGTT
jgi:hypothetical protein